MIHYHGTPITPEHAAVEILNGRHGLVSFANPQPLALVADICHSFVLDNGAFSFWKIGKQMDVQGYYRWVETWHRHPGFDWALIPDIIDGTGEANDRLIDAWPFGSSGVPVWHLHETLERLANLASKWPRVALGSSGEYAQVGTASWWARMEDAMAAICDAAGQPRAKLHGLRMLDPKVFGKFPFASADSTNIGRNIGIDKKWAKGNYLPPTKAARGVVMAQRIEHFNSSPTWQGRVSIPARWTDEAA